jgi:cytochrome c-type biogenesis protein CcmF
VHAFATDPKRGIFILGFLAVVIGGSLALYAWRANRVAPGARFELLSRESMLLANSVLLLVACAAVMLGTLYPLFLDALGLGKISVGPPYFDAVFMPLMAPAVLMAGIGPLIAWRKGDAVQLVRRLRWTAIVALVGALFVPLAFGRWSLLSCVGLLLAFWVIAGTATALVVRFRAQPAALGVAGRLRGLSSAFLGMLLAHAGIGVFIIGVTMVKSYESERDLRMAPGESATFGDYTFQFDGVRELPGPNYTAARAAITVRRGGEVIARMAPEKRVYLVQQNPMTEAAINASISRDLYVSLGEALEGGAWTVRIHVKPFVRWIWIGCLLMAFGGLLAASDRRYRAGVRERVAPTGDETLVRTA